MLIDPELLAILASLGLAAVLSAPSIRRRRSLAGACVRCGRRVLNGVKTCDCEHLAERL